MNTPLESWDRVLEVNLSSQFVLTQAIAAPMLDRGYGKVIFTASLLSFQGGINVPGLHRLEVRHRRTHEGPRQRMGGPRRQRQRDRPRLHRDRQHQALRSDPARSTAILDRIPAARWGRPDDLAGAAVFLASARLRLRLGHRPARRRRLAGPMTRTSVIDEISRVAVVPVVVIDDAAHAVDLARTLRDNGIATPKSPSAPRPRSMRSARWRQSKASSSAPAQSCSAADVDAAIDAAPSIS